MSERVPSVEDDGKFYPDDGEGAMQRGADETEARLLRKLQEATEPAEQAKAAKRLQEFRQSRKTARL